MTLPYTPKILILSGAVALISGWMSASELPTLPTGVRSEVGQLELPDNRSDTSLQLNKAFRRLRDLHTKKGSRKQVVESDVSWKLVGIVREENQYIALIRIDQEIQQFHEKDELPDGGLLVSIDMGMIRIKFEHTESVVALYEE